ncbi:amino acid adenylation domain-containing protein [Actinomadura sp. DC4]|uniref:non-ribosomal peptide synthetase n=1 Tax=Actinomadura sp. DC4 TaxID=3055069 RepID=UPI0025B09772|nr:amino acid adenylation domain-containing protein [Actinomadura sp. DC4]MDN3353818.1 amino acid adenylation domain-containing protein [Actinomadura sp. DC4]
MPGQSAGEEDPYSPENSSDDPSRWRFTGRAVDHGDFRTVSALIEEQTDRHPDHPAISYDGRTLTYGELDGLVNGLAAELAGRGVRKGDIVPLLVVNSLEMPVAYLALMKLGAPFVPLDPDWPDDRLRSTFGVLPRGLVLCAETRTVPTEMRDRAVVVDVDRVSPAPRRATVPLEPDDLIYGYFTSGTTGTPKCAMNRHGGLTNRLRYMTRYFGAAGEDVVLQNSKHTFDSSLWQLFWPLITGGHSVLPVQGEFLNLQHTVETIAEYGITAADFVSSVFNALAAHVDGDAEALRRLGSLRRLVVGSEPLNPDAVHRMMAQLPGLRVTNGYGPTEATIGMVFHPVSPEDGDAIPLGRPIDNCYAVVLDEELRPLPPGETGEIVIGGVCLGEGYLGDPVATAKAFIRNPFSDRIPGDRLYRTGDLGHLDEDGRLFFSGRKDFQVKIGGVRIELGEIAVAAENLPGVRQAEVLVAERPGARSLALFASGGDLSEERLAEGLRRTLPRVSVPRHYFLLTSMPLTDNGKVDRDRLQEILDARLAEDAVRLAEDAPSTGLPGQVLRALRSVLHQPGLAAGAHFMKAGGDSLQALSAVRTLTAECGVTVGVQDLYDHPTAEALTALIEERRRDGAAVESESVLMERDALVPGDEPILAADLDGPLTTVLVTGATGFVGTRLVHELLTRTDLAVRCLVRAPDDAQATARVAGALAERGLWEPDFAGRLEGFSGDLARPRLGLEERTWERLARGCDLVLHNAAMVNFLFDYRAHRQVNVRATAELLRLAMAYRPVPFHYVSTLSAFENEALRRGGGQPERFDPSGTVTPHYGYSRAKWVAERYLAHARERGALVTVLRLGEVLPSEDNAHPNPAALTHLLLSAFLRLGVRPDADIRTDYTPVDYAAARVVAAVRDRGVWGGTLHVFHPESVTLGAALPVAPVPCAEFLRQVLDVAFATGDRDLASLAALLPGPGADSGEDELKRSLADLLTDNPALFRKDECRRLEERWGLTDGPLHGAIAAYGAHLTALQAGTAGPAPLPTG